MFTLAPELHQFAPQFFGTLSDLKQSATTGRQEVIAVACSDHATAPDSVSFLGEHCVSIMQTMAACIPAEGDKYGAATLGSIEYDVGLEDAKHIIVCGHKKCDAIEQWSRSLDANATIAEHARFNMGARAAVDRVYSRETESQRSIAYICEHVLCQLDHLFSHDRFYERFRDGCLSAHGWFVDDDTGQVFAFDPVNGQFTPA